MLVLSRKLGEKVVISGKDLGLAEDIVVTVVDIDRGKIRLGFEAPRHVGVNRHEIDTAIKQNTRTVATVS